MEVLAAQQIHAKRTKSDKHHITSYALSSECIMVTHDLFMVNNKPTYPWHGYLEAYIN